MQILYFHSDVRLHAPGCLTGADMAQTPTNYPFHVQDISHSSYFFILYSTESNLADYKYVNVTITAMNYYMQRWLFGCQDGEGGRRPSVDAAASRLLHPGSQKDNVAYNSSWLQL